MNNEDDSLLKILTITSILLSRSGGSITTTEEELKEHTERIVNGEMRGIVAKVRGGKWVISEATAQDAREALTSTLRELLEATESILKADGLGKPADAPPAEAVSLEFNEADEKALKSFGFKL